MMSPASALDRRIMHHRKQRVLIDIIIARLIAPQEAA
jgi:hypothetical protein